MKCKNIQIIFVECCVFSVLCTGGIVYDKIYIENNIIKY